MMKNLICRALVCALLIGGALVAQATSFGVVTVSSQTNSAPILIDMTGLPNTKGQYYALGLVATVSPGANLTYKVQVTADPNPGTNGNWNDHDTMFNLTASANGNINFPVTAVRLVVTSYASGTVSLGVARWP